MASATTPSRPTPLLEVDRPANPWVPLGLLGLLILVLVGGAFGAYAHVTATAAAGQDTYFVFRRFEMPVKLFGREFDPYWFWLPILVPTLILGLVYVVWMYIRDSRTVGPWWATFLGVLRAIVYVILALVFLLPALQTWEKYEARSRVLLLVDLSGSMNVTDEQPSESTPPEKLPTRLNKVAEFLTDSERKFLPGLLEKNPVVLYGFGGSLDDDPVTFQKGDRPWTAEEWNAWLKLDPKSWLLAGLSPAGQDLVRSSAAFQGEAGQTPTEWASAWLAQPDGDAIPAGLGEEDKARLLAKRARLPKKLELRAQVLNATNVGDSVLAAVNREINNMLAGVIVLSDGRSNQGSTQAFEELRARLSKARVPLFAVIVGEDRPPIQIRITDLQVPEQTPPDEKFPVRVEVDGEGLPEEQVTVFLDVYRPKAEKPSVVLQAVGKFVPGEPPHAQVEFQIDPASDQFAPFRNPDAPKPELEEGEWRFVARVPRDKREAFVGKEHVSDPATVSIVKKPLRILLASGGGHDYQFLRTMLVREVDRKRAELSVYLQTGIREGERVQDVDPHRLLTHFPDHLRVEDDPTEKPEEKYYNLAQYDLIIAIDLDWTQVPTEHLALLQRWVETQAGGLIVAAGPIHTYQLARGVNLEKLKPIVDLYPVVLEDSRLQGLGIDRSTAEPWRLNFPGATADMEFLKLDDERAEPLAGWDEFFGQKGGTRRGFYNFYPVKTVKPGATVIATFSDPRARLTDGREQPFLVMQPFGKGKVIYIGSPETRRLRQPREVFFERFWTKLGRYAASGTATRVTRRGVLVMGRQFTAGSYVRLEAQLFGPTLEALPPTARPEATLTPPAGVTLAAPKFTLQPKPSQGEWTGWFQGRYLVTVPGEYRIDVHIPGSGDTLTSKFLVKEANPELDNTRPDFAAMWQLAGDLGDLRAGDEEKNQLKRRLKSYRPEAPAAGADRESHRLFFDLKSADAIPPVLTTDLKIQRSRGPVDDLWASGPELSLSGTSTTVAFSRWLLKLLGLGLIGVAIYLFTQRQTMWAIVSLVGSGAMFLGDVVLNQVASELLAAEKPMLLPTVLLVVVGLLSIEWLTRKLLRLA